MTVFVLLRKDQQVVRSSQAAQLVAQKGFKAAAAELGCGDSTLRKFLKDEGYRFSRHTHWQVEELPGMETDGRTDTDDRKPAVLAEPAPPIPGAVEHPGEAERPGAVEAAGV